MLVGLARRQRVPAGPERIATIRCLREAPEPRRARLVIPVGYPGMQARTVRVGVLPRPAINSMTVVAGQQVNEMIDWPDQQTWALNQSIATGSPEEKSEAGQLLIDTGDESAMNQARTLLERDRDFAPAYIRACPHRNEDELWTGGTSPVERFSRHSPADPTRQLEREDPVRSELRLRGSLRESRSVVQNGREVRHGQSLALVQLGTDARDGASDRPSGRWPSRWRGFCRRRSDAQVRRALLEDQVSRRHGVRLREATGKYGMLSALGNQGTSL